MPLGFADTLSAAMVPSDCRVPVSCDFVAERDVVERSNLVAVESGFWRRPGRAGHRPRECRRTSGTRRIRPRARRSRLTEPQSPPRVRRPRQSFVRVSSNLQASWMSRVTPRSWPLLEQIVERLACARRPGRRGAGLTFDPPLRLEMRTGIPLVLRARRVRQSADRTQSAGPYRNGRKECTRADRRRTARSAHRS